MTVHGPEHDRDVPRSCTCDWWWLREQRRFIRMVPDPFCEWHTGWRPRYPQNPQVYPQGVR